MSRASRKSRVVEDRKEGPNQMNIFYSWISTIRGGKIVLGESENSGVGESGGVQLIRKRLNGGGGKTMGEKVIEGVDVTIEGITHEHFTAQVGGSTRGGDLRGAVIMKGFFKTTVGARREVIKHNNRGGEGGKRYIHKRRRPS